MTKDCNMACRYCYEEDKTSGHTSWEEAKKFLDIINKDDNFSLEFMGGEPLLNFDLVRECINYLSNRNIIYYITTNGTLIDSDIIDFIKINSNIFLGISLDGTRFANSLRVFKDGKNSFEVVMNNIKKLVDEGITFLVHPVLHPYNIAYFVDSVDYLYNNGVRQIDPGVVEKTLELTDEFCKEFIKQHDIVSSKILEGEYPGLKVITLESYDNSDKKKKYIRGINSVVGESNSDTAFNGFEVFQGEGNSKIRQLKLEVYNNHQSQLKGRY